MSALRNDLAIVPPPSPDAAAEAMCIRQWLSGRKEKPNEHTARAYSAALSLFLASSRAESVRAAAKDWETAERSLRAFYAALDGKAPRTKAQRLSAMCKLFSLLAARGLVPAGIDKLVVRPEIDWEAPQVEDLPSAEKVSEMLLAEPSDRNRLMLSVLYLTGMRVSECAGLDWADLRWREDAVVITIRGKGSKTRRVAVSDAWVVGELAALRSAGRVFGLSARRISEICLAAWRRVGVTGPDGRGSSAHLIRHTMATLARVAGASETELADALGHSSTRTTKLYGAQVPSSAGRRLSVPFEKD